MQGPLPLANATWLTSPVEDYDFEPVQDTDGEMAFHLLVNRVWLGGIEDEVWDILHGLIPDFDG